MASAGKAPYGFQYKPSAARTKGPFSQILPSATRAIGPSRPGCAAGPPENTRPGHARGSRRPGSLPVWPRQAGLTAGPVGVPVFFPSPSDAGTAKKPISPNFSRGPVAIARQIWYHPGWARRRRAGSPRTRRCGVCNDMSKLLVAMLRSQGIPAYYQSGVSSAGTNHAWVRTWVELSKRNTQTTSPARLETGTCGGCFILRRSSRRGHSRIRRSPAIIFFLPRRRAGTNHLRPDGDGRRTRMRGRPSRAGRSPWPGGPRPYGCLSAQQTSGPSLPVPSFPAADPW